MHSGENVRARLQLIAAWPSKWQVQWLPCPLRSVLVRSHCAVVDAVLPLGPLSAVSGGVVSILKRSMTGVGSVAPPKLARTAKVWSPSLRLSKATGEEQPVNAAPSSEHSNEPPRGVEMSGKLGVCRRPDR